MVERMLNYLFPPKCIFCREVLDSVSRICICSACFGDLQFYAAEFTKIDDKNIRYNYMDGILCLCEYSGKIKKSLQQYKFNNKQQYFRTYGRLLAEKLKETGTIGEIDIIIAIPLHKKREKDRGYNQSRLVSKVMSKETSIPDMSHLISRIKNTGTQRLLKGSERHRNVKDAFAVLKPFEIIGKTILVVDDILTTGSTMNECCRLLKEQGACRVYGAVIASGRKDLSKLVRDN